MSPGAGWSSSRSDAAVHTAVIETLRDAQRFGFFGPGPIEPAAEHALAYVSGFGPLGSGARICDLGSGGGLPGLVIADACPDASILLIDRRQKRTDFLERAVSRLGWSHVAVRCDDVEVLIDEVAGGDTPPFDVVTARSFGPPATTLRMALALLTSDGCVVISEPPAGDRWDPALLAELNVTSDRQGPVRVFRRSP